MPWGSGNRHAALQQASLAWSPLQLPDLRGLFIASDANLVSAGGKVSQWFNLADLSGATDAVQNTGAAQPSWSGSGYVNCASGSHFLVAPGVLTGQKPWSLITIRRLNSTGGSGYTASVGSTIAGNNGFGGNVSSGNLQLTAKGVSTSVDGAADTSCHLVVYTCNDQLGVSLSIDGVPVVLTLNTLASIKTPTGGLVIGAGFDTGAAGGDVSEAVIAVMSSVISAGDVARLQAYRLANAGIWS